MSQQYDLNNEEQLDQSIEEDQPQNFKRDSALQHLNFDEEQYHNDHNFRSSENSSGLMRDSQFEEEGVFSYNDDYRMRQSMKSEEDFELEDISGNADMSDRHDVSKSKPQANKINIVEEYNENGNINAFSKHSEAHDQQKTDEKQEDNKRNVEKKKEQVQPSKQKVDLNPPSKSNQEVEQFQKSTKQQQKAITQGETKVSGSTQIPAKVQVPMQMRIPITQQKPQTPQKQIPIQQIEQSQTWSNQSNKSYSPPFPEAQIYSKSPNHQDSIKQTTQEKPKISLLKQSFTLIKQPAPQPSSSIRDWFRPSNSKPQQNLNSQSPSRNLKPGNQLQQVKQKSALQSKQEQYRKEMQAQMLGVQQSISQHQKINKLFGTQEKEKQKVKLNKTQVATSKKFISSFQSDDVNSEECRMLLKISFEKKKENYQTVKQWDKRRAENMGLHRNLIETLQSEVDKRIKSSLENFQIYTSFFRQKLRQQEKFTTSPVLNTRYALQHSPISKTLYINCSVILNSLCEDNQSKTKKILDFISLIKNNVLKDLMQQHLHQSQKQLLKVRQKISNLRNSLKKYNTQTQQKSQQLATLFTQSCSNVSLKCQHDFYTVQLDFLRSASQQTLIQKRLAQHCLEYYHTALNEELKRASVIRNALVTYSKGLKETYGVECEDVGLEQLSKAEEVRLIQEFYQVEDMLDDRSHRLLKDKLNINHDQDLTIANLSVYLETFEFEPFNSRMLLLKEFHARYFSGKDSKTAREEPCHMAITVDFFLHLSFSPEKLLQNFKPDISLKIVPKELQIRSQKDQFVDIVKKQERRGSMISYFWDSKNQKTYRIKFASKDAKEEFCDYVKKLMF